MKTTMLAGALAVLVAGGPAVAAEDVDAVRLGRVIEILNELIAQGVSPETAVNELSLDLEGVEETYAVRAPKPGGIAVLERLEMDERGTVTLTLLTNMGACATMPVDWRLVRDFGSYLIEFCDHGSIHDAAHGDYHRHGNGSGGLGGYMQTLDFRCSVYAEYSAMTNRARMLFC